MQDRRRPGSARWDLLVALVGVSYRDRRGSQMNEEGRPTNQADTRAHIPFWYVIAAILGMLFIQDLYLANTQRTAIPYSQFETLLNEDKVERIAISQNYITGELKEAQPDGLKDFITARVDPDLAQSL